jgi:hypothetical protein
MVLVLTGCGSAGGPAGGSGPAAATVPAEVVFFDPGGSAPGQLGAVSDHPINVGAFAGWYGAGAPSSDEIAAKPDTTYVLVTGATGCRAPERAELVRDGDDLTARFVGGEDRPECVRQVGPSAQFAVNAASLRDVRTIGGKQPLDPNGPGKLEQFIQLGPAPVGTAAKPAELGTPAAAELSQALRTAGSTNLDQAAQVLAAPPPAGRRGFAFVATGCRQDGAVLIVAHDTLSAKLTGGTGTVCVAPAHFLTVFSIDHDRISQKLTLTQG